MDLLARVRRFVARNRLFDRSARVVVAVSGGSDSVALAHLLRELSTNGECQVAGVAHFNHQLRPTAERDERFTVALAESFGWAVTLGREDVASRARRESRSIEGAARTARHEFFEHARSELGADLVAVGHTRDDQAETLLLRLLRGAGPKGLAGMHPHRGAVVRPLLSCRRHELQEYLAERHATYVDDESNADRAIPRNRIRADLLPLLAREFNPAVVDVLADEAALMREIWEWMENESLKFEVGSLKSEALNSPGTDLGADPSDFRLQTSDFEVSALLALPPPLRRLALWRAMCAHSGPRHVSFGHVEAGLELLESGGPRSVDVPGCRLERLGGRLVLTRRAADGARGRPGDANVSSFDYPLSIPGEVALPQAGCVLAAESPSLAVDPAALGANAAAVRRDRCVGQLRVRNRRRGDRFQPFGLHGRKKLQDYFVDRKVARHDRDTVPLVVDETDRIVWVAGFEIDEAFRVTDPAQAVLILRLKLLGGPR